MEKRRAALAARELNKRELQRNPGTEKENGEDGTDKSYSIGMETDVPSHLVCCVQDDMVAHAGQCGCE